MTKQVPGDLTIVITGPPKVGKSTVGQVIANAMRDAGAKVDIQGEDKPEQRAFEPARARQILRKRKVSIVFRFTQERNFW